MSWFEKAKVQWPGVYLTDEDRAELLREMWPEIEKLMSGLVDARILQALHVVQNVAKPAQAPGYAELLRRGNNRR